MFFMVDADLYALYQLHLVDNAILDLQHHAAALDTGKQDSAELKSMDEKTAPQRAATKKLMGDLKELEDEQKAVEAKSAMFDKKLYDGSVTSAREIEHLQKEILMLMEQFEARQHRIDAIRETLPAMQEEALATEKAMAEKQALILKKRESAKKIYADIQAAFEKIKAKRPPLAAEVPAEFARVYDAVRHKTNGTGMATVTDVSTCSHCGMHVAEKACEMIRMGRLTPCEGCGRILFIVQPT